MCDDDEASFTDTPWLFSRTYPAFCCCFACGLFMSTAAHNSILWHQLNWSSSSSCSRQRPPASILNKHRRLHCLLMDGKTVQVWNLQIDSVPIPRNLIVIVIQTPKALVWLLLLLLLTKLEVSKRETTCLQWDLIKTKSWLFPFYGM